MARLIDGIWCAKMGRWTSAHSWNGDWYCTACSKLIRVVRT